MLTDEVVKHSDGRDIDIVVHCDAGQRLPIATCVLDSEVRQSCDLLKRKALFSFATCGIHGCTASLNVMVVSIAKTPATDT